MANVYTNVQKKMINLLDEGVLIAVVNSLGQINHSAIIVQQIGPTCVNTSVGKPTAKAIESDLCLVFLESDIGFFIKKHHQIAGVN